METIAGAAKLRQLHIFALRAAAGGDMFLSFCTVTSRSVLLKAACGSLREIHPAPVIFTKARLRAEVGFLNSALISHAPSAMLLLWTKIGLTIPKQIENILSFQILECDL